GFLFLLPVAYCAGLYAVFQAATGRTVAIGRCLGVGFRKLPRCLGVIFLYVLAVIGGLALLVVPGIYAYFSFLLAVPVVVVEEVGVIEAFRRSAKLIDGFRVTAFGVLLVLFLLNMVLKFGAVVLGLT